MFHSRSRESQMYSSKQHQSTLGMVMKEEEELALFLEMRKHEKETNGLQKSAQIDAPSENKPGSFPISKIVSSAPVRKTRVDDFLNSENGKSDYDWLLTPPGTPFITSLERQQQKTTMSQNGITNAESTDLRFWLANPLGEGAFRGNIVDRQQTLSTSINSYGRSRRPIPSGGPGSTASRPATPTSRPTLSATAKTSRPSTPTSRATFPSAKSTAPVRSSTPTRSAACPSTPTVRSSIPASRSASRSATPTRRPSTPSIVPSVYGPPGQSSSVTKSGATMSKSSVISRGSSPTVKSRPWNPSEMPGFSLETPPNLRTSMPERPASASRGRPAAPSARSSSVDANGRLRRQSCSPSRGRAPHGNSYSSGRSVPAISRGHSKSSDSVSPVLIGTQMVERVVSMRKLAPPKQDDNRSSYNNSSGKPSSPDSSGFGRSLSKKSLDMALRHMDIRRSIPGNLRPLMMKVPASSLYSVRSRPTSSRTDSVSDSPLATSSNASSELSVNNNPHYSEGSEVEDSDLGSERGQLSPVLRGR
ncbi:uncharacterized protein LOC131167288 isoform X2 [Malania oleifera]|uniref:uncharacterized protein LOC131167288 isoform X2 n=1 Tax=Malania oleifera TaxID=397392 RepID=UPI0025AD9D8D|nr:uncharacterized protein LOC131167288 isoform X2 [Malania oleifera]